MPTVPLNVLAFARPGDKGDDSDIAVFARSRPAYEHLVDVLTAEVVRAHMADLVTGEVTRWEVPNVWALKFLLRGALGGGGPASLRADNLGKSLGGAILRLPIEVGADLLHAHPDLRPPSQPYTQASWVIRG